MSKISDRVKRRDDIHRLKTRPFTLETLAEFRIKRALMAEIDRSRGLAGKDISSFRIFDLGCGAAQTIAYLRALGYDAWGGEASHQQFDLARRGLEGIGLDPSEIVLLDLSSGKYPIPDQYFDFVYSDNVLEHVENLESFVQEADRLTRTGGWGIHIFPSRWRLIEAHVRVPFVHWTRNSSVRLALIRLSIAMGIRGGCQPSLHQRSRAAPHRGASQPAGDRPDAGRRGGAARSSRRPRAHGSGLGGAEGVLPAG